MSNREGPSSIDVSNVTESTVVFGDNNVVSHQSRVSHGTDVADLKASIGQLGVILHGLVDARDAPRVKGAIEEALREVESKEPRKDVVSDAVDRALKIVAAAESLSGAADRLRPLLERVQVWLGHGFESLIRWLG